MTMLFIYSLQKSFIAFKSNTLLSYWLDPELIYLASKCAHINLLNGINIHYPYLPLEMSDFSF